MVQQPPFEVGLVLPWKHLHDHSPRSRRECVWGWVRSPFPCHHFSSWYLAIPPKGVNEIETGIGVRICG